VVCALSALSARRARGIAHSQPSHPHENAHRIHLALSLLAPVSPCATRVLHTPCREATSTPSLSLFIAGMSQ
jgi:hypothetical protein